MENKDILYYLALQSAEGIGDIIAKRLISRCGNAQAVFKEKHNNLEKINGIGSWVIKGLKNSSLLISAEKEMEFINKNNINVFIII